MKNLKVTINRSAGVKKYEVLPRQEKDMRGCCFCIKNANCQKKTKIRSSRLRKVLRSDTIILYLPRPGRQFTERYRLQWTAIFLF